MSLLDLLNFQTSSKKAYSLVEMLKELMLSTFLSMADSLLTALKCAFSQI